MENNTRSEVSISISEGKFEIKGSEEFVSKQIENLKDIIEKSLNESNQSSKKIKVAEKNEATLNPTNSSISESDSSSSEFEEKYADIYAIDGDDVIIVADVPGSSSSAQTLNVAILYTYAQMKLGIDETKVDEIRKICESHGFLDVANFSSHIKRGDPKLYIDKGKGKERAIKLTRPGIKKAEEIISTMLGDG